MPISRPKPDFTDYITWSFAGTLTLTPDEVPWGPLIQIELIAVKALLRTTSAGAAVIFDIRRHLTSTLVDQGSIFPTTGDRPQIAIGGFAATYNFVAPLPRWTTTSCFIGKPVQIGSGGTEGKGGSLTLLYRAVLD